MIQLHIPAEYADAVREAMTCKTCDGRRSLGGEYGGTEFWCPDCPPSFWWGIVGEQVWAQSTMTTNGHVVTILPEDVQEMLDPCPRWRTVTEGDVSYGYCEVPEPPNICDCIEGRPLVELVTDCDHLPVQSDSGPTCIRCLDRGFVSLGVVTAAEVLPIWNEDGECPHTPHFFRDWRRVGGIEQHYTVHCDGESTDEVPVFGPSNATHAIHLTGVTP